MDQINFYYLQRVLESELDLVQTNALASLKKARQDLDIMGVHAGGVVTKNAPPDLHVLVSGPGLCSDPAGERVYWAAQQTVDCSQDHLGGATAVTNILNERWISVIAEFDQVLSLPVTDGNGVTVYTRITDSFNLYVTMAVEQVIGTNLKPALPVDGVLLADAKLVFAQVQILAADLDISRRQDLVHETGAVIPTFYHGTLTDAVVALFGYVDALATAVGVVFTATATWLDASTIASANVNGAINEILTDLKANAGAARTGSAAHVTVGNYCDLANGALQTNLNTIADNVAGHINGGAPAHPDTAVTSAAQAGTPEAWAGGSVRGFLTGLLGHVNARTERATDETVSAGWRYQNGQATPALRAKQTNNVNFENSPSAKTLLGGSISPWESLAQAACDLHLPANSWAQAWAGINNVITTLYGPGLGGNEYNFVDVCWIADTTGRRYVCLLNDYGAAAFKNQIIWFDPHDIAATITVLALGGGLPAPVVRWMPTACCSDGRFVYVMFTDPNGVATEHRVQSYDVAAGIVNPAWPATGVLLPGLGLGGSFLMSERIKMVDTVVPRLATLNSWVAAAVAGTSQCISIISATDGTINDSGCGDCPTAATTWPSEALASDGTNVYFGFHTTATGVGGIATVQIADPDVGKAVYTPDTPGPIWPRDAVFDGGLLWVTEDTSPAGGGPGSLKTYNPTSDYWVESQTIGTVAHHGHLAFDGANIWVQAMRDEDPAAGVEEAQLLFKIPVASAKPFNQFVVPAEEQKQVVVYLTMGPGSGAGGELGYEVGEDMGRMCFDGDGVWTLLWTAIAAGDRHGIVRRVPRVGMR